MLSCLVKLDAKYIIGFYCFHGDFAALGTALGLSLLFYFLSRVPNCLIIFRGCPPGFRFNSRTLHTLDYIFLPKQISHVLKLPIDWGQRLNVVLCVPF